MIKRFIDKNATGKKVLVLFSLTSLVFLYMMLVSIPQVLEHAVGMQLLDLMPTGYSYEYVQTLFDTLGQKGRDAYLYHQIPIDMIYPGLYGLCYCLMFSYLLKKISKFQSAYIYLSLLPILAGLADYLENMGIITMLQSYPTISKSIVSVSCFFSMTKSTISIVFFTTLFILIITWLSKRLRKSTY